MIYREIIKEKGKEIRRLDYELQTLRYKYQGKEINTGMYVNRMNNDTYRVIKKKGKIYDIEELFIIRSKGDIFRKHKHLHRLFVKVSFHIKEIKSMREKDKIISNKYSQLHEYYDLFIDPVKNQYYYKNIEQGKSYYIPVTIVTWDQMIQLDIESRQDKNISILA